VLFYDVPVWIRLGELVLVIAMATIAFVAVGTLLSAMAVRTRYAELMLRCCSCRSWSRRWWAGAAHGPAAGGRPLSDLGAGLG